MPKGTQKVHFSFDETHITHFGGMWLIQSFCRRLGLKKLLQDYIRFARRNQFYQTSELVLALMYTIIMGLPRINKTEILQYNGAFLEMLGLKRFPDQSSLRRFLKRLPPDAIRRLVRLHDSLRAYLYPLPRERSTLTFDLDSVVITVYGEQEGARVGYNPRKHGRRSYHPLLCFESRFQEFWHGSLRPGNTVAMTGAIFFIKACLAKVPRTIGRRRIRFRMDAGFYGNPLIRFLDEKGCGYVIVAPKQSKVRECAQACRFRSLGNGWQVGEFWHKVHAKSEREHRFVVARRPIPDDPVEARQLTLFKDKKYAYHIFVTNLTMDPWRVYLFYSPRATIEKNIRELLYDYPLSKIPTDSWTSNVAFFQLLLFAANIVHWFKRLCLPQEWRTATVGTVRNDFIVLPAKLVKKGSHRIVRLPHDHHYQKEFLQASRNVQKLHLPGKFRFCR